MAPKAMILQRLRKTTILESYFVSSCNSADPSSIHLPKHVAKHAQSASTISSAGQLGESSTSGESLTPAGDRANLAVHLICPSGLSNLPEVADAEEDDNVVEVVNVDNNGTSERKAKRKSYEVSRKCQDSWAIQHPWAEMVRGDRDTIIDKVRCRICTQVSGHDVLIGPKTDTLEKHSGKRIADKDMPHLGIKTGEVFVRKGCRHQAAVKTYNDQMRHRPSIAEEVSVEFKGEKARKIQQFATIFHLLQQGRPMVEYEALEELFGFLKIPHLSRKHWSDSDGWIIAEYIHREITSKTKQNLVGYQYFAITCDEVTIVDNVSWISVHAYVVIDFAIVPMLLSLEKVTEGATTPRLAIIIMDAIEEKGGVARADMRRKWISFGEDGAAVFQGSRVGVTKLLQKTVAPHMEGVHCFSHRTNLVVKALSHLPVIAKIETLLQTLHGYFSASPKRHLEFTKLAVLMHTKGLKITMQIKTRWLSMLSPLKRVMGEYKTLLLKMSEDRLDKDSRASAREAARKNFELLSDISISCALAYFLPLLETVHDLIKFSQQRDVFVCDYVAAVKVCQTQLYEQYLNQTTRFVSDVFREFHHFVAGRHPSMSICWTPSSLDLNSNNPQHVQWSCGVARFDAVTGNEFGIAERVTKENFEEVISCVKSLCAGAAQQLIHELSGRFPASNIMDSLGVMYPQYWLQPNADALFERHFSVLKENFCHERRIGDVTSAALLSEDKLNQQCSIFKSTMMGNAANAMEKPITLNPLTRLWRNVATSAWLRATISEWIKLSEIAVVQVLGSVEDERIFSSVAFLKGKLRNRLDEHLECAVGVYSQKYYTLKNFPFDNAYEAWRKDKKRKLES